MNALSKKFVRIQRLRALEESKMNSLVVELAAIESRLNNQRSRLAQLKKHLAASFVLPDSARVDMHCQAMLWIDHVQSSAARWQQKIRETEAQRDLMLDQVIQQKTTVRGWETLQAQLSKQITSESMNSESSVADDRHLNTRLAR